MHQEPNLSWSGACSPGSSQIWSVASSKKLYVAKRRRWEVLMEDAGPKSLTAGVLSRRGDWKCDCLPRVHQEEQWHD
jgi:hypothetical protein